MFDEYKGKSAKLRITRRYLPSPAAALLGVFSINHSSAVWMFWKNNCLSGLLTATVSFQYCPQFFK
jgi:hypothetical protein